MKQKLSVIQPYLHIAFKDVPNKDFTSPCGMHLYDGSEKNIAALTLPETVNIIPSASCVWIIAYNTPARARFICIGSQSEITSINLGSFKNYFIAVFEDNAVYFNKGASRDLKPSDLADRVVDFEPDSACPEYEFLNKLSKCEDFNERIKVFKEFLSGSKRSYAFGSDLAKMRTLIADADGDYSVNELAAATGYSSRHINRLFSETYGFGPKDLCKRMRFQHALREIFEDPNRQNSEFIQNIGYSDQAHFQREFKVFMGDTPKQFAKKIKG